MARFCEASKIAARRRLKKVQLKSVQTIGLLAKGHRVRRVRYRGILHLEERGSGLPNHGRIGFAHLSRIIIGKTVHKVAPRGEIAVSHERPGNPTSRGLV